MNLRRTAGFALLGMLVPLVCEGALRRYPDSAGPWVFLIWPSYIIAIAHRFSSSTSDVGIILIESIAINVLLYAGIGWIVGLLYSRHQWPDR
jgi:hypothetical protein